MLRRVLSLTPRNTTPIATPWRYSNIDYSPDGRLVAYSRFRGNGAHVGPASGSIGVVDMQTWQAPAVQPHQAGVGPVFSNDGRWMAVMGYGRRLQVIDQGSATKVLDEHQDDMFDAVFDGAGETLYVARTDGVIEVRHAPNWQAASRLRYRADGERVNRVAIAIAPDSRRLLVYGRIRTGGVGEHPWLSSGRWRRTGRAGPQARDAWPVRCGRRHDRYGQLG